MSTPSIPSLTEAVNLGAALELLIKSLRARGISYREAVHEFERRWILQELEVSGGNHARAARALGMHRNTLWRTRQILKIERPYRTGRRKLAPTGARTSVQLRSSSIADLPGVNSVRKGGRGESPELLREGARAHLANKPSRSEIRGRLAEEVS